MDLFESIELNTWRCPCCLESAKGQVVMLSCTHNFCLNCINTVREEQSICGQLCPVCRCPNQFTEYMVNEYLTFYTSLSLEKDDEDKLPFDKKDSREPIIDSVYEKYSANLRKGLTNMIKERESNKNEVVKLHDDYQNKMVAAERRYAAELAKISQDYSNKLTKHAIKEKNYDADIEVLNMNIAIRQSLKSQPEEVFSKHRNRTDDVYKRLVTNIFYPYITPKIPLSRSLNLELIRIDDDNIYLQETGNNKFVVHRYGRWGEEYKCLTLDIKNWRWCIRGDDLIVSNTRSSGQVNLSIDMYVYDTDFTLINKFVIDGIDKNYQVAPWRKDSIVLWRKDLILICFLKNYSRLEGTTYTYNFENCKIRAISYTFPSFTYEINHVCMYEDKIYIDVLNTSDERLLIIQDRTNTITTYNLRKKDKIHMRKGKIFIMFEDGECCDDEFQPIEQIPVIDSMGNYIKTTILDSGRQFKLEIMDSQ